MTTLHPARCQGCKLEFPNKKAVRQHAIAAGHTGVISFICRDCDQGFGTLGQYSDHVSTTGHMSCAKCLLRFISVFELSTHLQIAHGQQGLVKGCVQCGRDVPIEGVHLECQSKPVPCPICRKRFANSKKLAQHCKTTSSCVSCSICLRPSETLSDHLWTSKMHPKCLPCKLGFNKMADLAQHNLTCEALLPAKSPSPSDVLPLDTELTVVAPVSTPFVILDARPSPREDVGTPSWHCGSCLREPCVDPITTICGHLFCHGCFIRELSEKTCCPVCGKTFFVRLHVER